MFFLIYPVCCPRLVALVKTALLLFSHLANCLSNINSGAFEKYFETKRALVDSRSMVIPKNKIGLVFDRYAPDRLLHFALILEISTLALMFLKT